MNIIRIAAGLVAGLLIGGVAVGPAQAQRAVAAMPAAELQGMLVRGQGGVVLGQVDRVVLKPDGSPAQILVKPKRPPGAGSRSVAVAALKREGDSLMAPLTQAEFNAMPVVAID